MRDGDAPARSGSEPALSLRLDLIRFAAEGVLQFEFRRPDGGELPAFTAGAHVDVHLPTGLVRQYSLAGSPDDRGRYVIAVKRDATSRGGSRWMFERPRVGDMFAIGLPRNQFALSDDAGCAWFLAGGIGITPIYCMVNRRVETGREWRLFYAVRHRREAAFLDSLSRHGERFRLHVDEEAAGRPIDVAALVAQAPDDAHLYCCGPAPMLDAFEAATSGRPPERIHLERFAASPTAGTAGGFTVTLARSGRCLRVAPGRSIASTLAEAGVQVSVSCEQGICGTCETRVLEGVPEHRDLLLSSEEKARNDVMMICCSGSLTDTLVLDL